MWAFAGAALAGESGAFDAALFGKSFAPKTALALADPAAPGTLALVVASTPITCADAKALSKQQKPAGKKLPTLIVAAFDDPGAGHPATVVMVMGPKGLGGLTGQVTLVTAPGAAGSKGAARFDLAYAATSKEGLFGGIVASAEGDHATGELTFEQCDAVAPQPSLAGTTFTEKDHTIVRKSLLPDRAPEEMRVRAALPDGWTPSESPFGEPVFTAPDGRTVLTFGLSTPSEPFESSMRDWATSQVDAFQTEATRGELVKAELAGEGAFVVRWRNRWGDGPWTNHLEVFRQGAGWSHAVQCSLQGADHKVAEVFDAVEKACVALAATP